MNKITKYLLLASFIGTAAEAMLTPLYGMFVKEIGGGVLEAGIGAAIFSILTGLIIIISANIKWFNANKELVVFLGFSIASVGDFSYFFVHNGITLFAVQATNGISVGLLNPAWEALYSVNTDEGSEHKSWSIWGAGANIAIGIAAITGAGIVNFFGFKTMFVCTAAVNGIAIYYSYLIYKKRNES